MSSRSASRGHCVPLPAPCLPSTMSRAATPPPGPTVRDCSPLLFDDPNRHPCPGTTRRRQDYGAGHVVGTFGALQPQLLSVTVTGVPVAAGAGSVTCHGTDEWDGTITG